MFQDLFDLRPQRRAAPMRGSDLGMPGLRSDRGGLAATSSGSTRRGVSDPLIRHLTHAAKITLKLLKRLVVVAQ